MKKIRSIIFTLLILLLIFSIGVFIAAVSFVTNGNDFNLKDILNFDRQNKGALEENINEGVTKRVVVLEENAVIDVIDKASPAVVSIVSERRGIDPYRGIVQEEQGIGTGFIVQDGYVFTNKHVVSQDLTYRVVLNDGETSLKVLEIETDPLNDFAILKVEKPNDLKLPELKLGNSESLKVGQTVIAIGNALGEFKGTASKGIISGISRTIVAGSGFGQTEVLDNVIQTDAALNPGNSGGPLLDLEGKVIGINVARAGAENIGFAIPINELKPIFESFLDVGEIQRPYLGIQYRMNTETESKLNRLPVGAVVLDVLPDTPAANAGLEQYDVITEIDGQKLDADTTLARVIATKKVGQKITLTIDRDKEIKTLDVTLEAAK